MGQVCERSLLFSTYICRLPNPDFVHVAWGYSKVGGVGWAGLQQGGWGYSKVGGVGWVGLQQGGWGWVGGATRSCSPHCSQTFHNLRC